jgi:hypothetical protein
MYTPPNAPAPPRWFDELDLREEPSRGRLSAETQPTPTVPTALTCDGGTNFLTCGTGADTPPPEASATCNQP